MSSNHLETNYSKQYKKKLNKKDQSLHTISVELKKAPNILYNNYQNYNNNQIKIINLSNNNNIQFNPKKNNQIFKNIKLYGVSKKTNFIKKRNIKTKKLNAIPYVSFTEINPNLKKTFSNNFNAHTTQKNNGNFVNFNNTINLYHKNYHSNNNKNIIKINKTLPKSKSNKIFLTPFQHYHFHGRNKITDNALIKSNTNYSKSYNNSYNKKVVSSKINKYHLNFSPSNTNHTPSISVKKTIKFNENRQKTRNKTVIEEDKMKIQKLIKEKENREKEIKCKDQIIKEQEKIINLLKQNELQIKKQNQIINNKYEELKGKYQNIINENQTLKDKINEDEQNINFLKEKELKLMRILYLLKEKGIDINTILNDVKEENNTEQIYKMESYEENNIHNSSNLTVYFPDKVNMKNIMDTKEAQKVPNIDLNFVPEYSFHSDDEKQNNNDDEAFQQDDLNIKEIGFNKYELNNPFQRNSA